MQKQIVLFAESQLPLYLITDLTGILCDEYSPEEKIKSICDHMLGVTLKYPEVNRLLRHQYSIASNQAVAIEPHGKNIQTLTELLVERSVDFSKKRFISLPLTLFLEGFVSEAFPHFREIQKTAIAFNEIPHIPYELIVEQCIPSQEDPRDKGSLRPESPPWTPKEAVIFTLYLR